MRGFLLTLALLGAPSASGQAEVPTEAVTADGQRILIYDAGLWVHADSVWTGLQGGGRVESETGRFAVHVPPGWSVDPPTGEMLEGEFLLIREADSVYVSPMFVEVSDPALIAPLAQSMVTQFVVEMGVEDVSAATDDAEVSLVRRRLLDGRLLLSQSVTYLDGGGAALHVFALITSSGIVLVIGYSPTLRAENTVQDMVRRIEILGTE